MAGPHVNTGLPVSTPALTCIGGRAWFQPVEPRLSEYSVNTSVRPFAPKSIHEQYGLPRSAPVDRSASQEG